MFTWNVDPEIVKIWIFSIRWYGLLFASGFVVGFPIMTWIYKNENKNVDNLNDLLWYMMLGVVLGARLGHCLFYDPVYYLSNPLQILFIWKGGLASHGAAIGVTLALVYYSRRFKDQPFLWVADRIVIPSMLGGAFIRIGNFFNSEIIGKPTGGDWGVIFERNLQYSQVPRHPAQLYEAIAYLLIFAFLINFYRITKGKFREGFTLGMFLILVFAFRLFVENFKENQSSFEQGMLLNMGQILSIIPILAGIYLVFFHKPKPKNTKGKKIR